MWSTFLEDPKSFRNKILSFYVKGETTNRPQDLFAVLPEWLDTRDFELDYRPNQKLLIFFTNSKTPFLTHEAPVVFEVITMESYYQDKKLKGKMMNILEATIEEVIDYIDNLPGGVPGTEIDKVLEEASFEEHNILVKALLSGFDSQGNRV